MRLQGGDPRGEGEWEGSLGGRLWKFYCLISFFVGKKKPSNRKKGLYSSTSTKSPSFAFPRSFFLVV